MSLLAHASTGAALEGACVLAELEASPQHQEAPKAPGDQSDPAALSAPPARLPTHVAADAASVASLACTFSYETFA